MGGEHDDDDAHLQFDMVSIIDPMGEQRGRQVDVGKVTAVKVVEPVSSEAFDPFLSWAVVELRI